MTTKMVVGFKSGRSIEIVHGDPERYVNDIRLALQAHYDHPNVFVSTDNSIINVASIEFIIQDASGLQSSTGAGN